MLLYTGNNSFPLNVFWYSVTNYFPSSILPPPSSHRWPCFSFFYDTKCFSFHKWMTMHATSFFMEFCTVVHCGLLDFKCSTEASYIQRWDFWKFNVPWGRYSHQWINPLLSSYLNLPLGGEVSPEEVGHCGHDLEQCVLVPDLCLLSLFPSCHRWTAFFHFVLQAVLPCSPPTVDQILWVKINLSFKF